MAESRVGEARFSLIIQGDELPVEAIEQQLALANTRLIRKGEVLSRLPLIEAETDEWLYAIDLTDPTGTDAHLAQLLKHLEDHKAALGALADSHQVTLRLYVQSDYAQMAYRLMPETLQRIAALNLPLSISSLSWGQLVL